MKKQDDKSMLMHNPPHVGEILRELYLAPLNISITEAAVQLGITRQALSRLLNEKTGISAEMAIRLSKAFDTSADFWMNLEKQYELAQALKRSKNIKVHRFQEAA